MASLMRSARESVPIIAVAAVLVASAAPIEAFVSPSGLPWAAKGVVALVCALLLAFYLVALGRRAPTSTEFDAEEAESLESGEQLRDLNTPENQMMRSRVGRKFSRRSEMKVCARWVRPALLSEAPRP